MRGLYIIIAGILCVSVASCSIGIKKINKNTQSQTAVNTIVGHKWQLIALNGKAAGEDKQMKKTPYAQFGADSSINGNSGCNGYGGKYILKGNNGIAISEVISTMMACMDSDVQQQETALFRLYRDADHYTLSNNILTIYSKDGKSSAKFKWVE